MPGPSPVYVLHAVLFVQVFLYQHIRYEIVYLQTKMLARVICLRAWEVVFAGDPVSLARNDMTICILIYSYGKYHIILVLKCE